MLEFTLITCHYGDTYWVTSLLKSLSESSEDLEFIVLDNSGNYPNTVSSQHKLNLTVVNMTAIAQGTGSENHASSLNWALRNLDLSGSQILILDSDMVVLQESNFISNLKQLVKENECIVALQEGSKYLSHPCFMTFPKQIAKQLDFMEGMREFGFDTGRLIGLQLRKMGFLVKKVEAERNPFASIGYFYSSLGAVHLTSSSLQFLPSRLSRRNSLWFLKQIARKQIHTCVQTNRKFGAKDLLIVFVRSISLKIKKRNIF